MINLPPATAMKLGPSVKFDKPKTVNHQRAMIVGCEEIDRLNNALREGWRVVHSCPLNASAAGSSYISQRGAALVFLEKFDAEKTPELP